MRRSLSAVPPFGGIDTGRSRKTGAALSNVLPFGRRGQGEAATTEYPSLPATAPQPQAIPAVARDGRGLRVPRREEIVGGILVLLMILALTGVIGRWGLPVLGQCRSVMPQLVFGSEAEARMATSGGTACAAVMRTGSARIDEIEVLEVPRNGAVSLRGRTGVTYRAAAGFHGDDSFVIALRGRSTSAESAGTATATAVVRVAVAVQ
jgi:hypothetical protein